MARDGIGASVCGWNLGISLIQDHLWLRIQGTVGLASVWVLVTALLGLSIRMQPGLFEMVSAGHLRVQLEVGVGMNQWSLREGSQRREPQGRYLGLRGGRKGLYR